MGGERRVINKIGNREMQITLRKIVKTLKCYVLYLITVEYGIQLTALKRVESNSRKSEDGKSKGG